LLGEDGGSGATGRAVEAADLRSLKKRAPVAFVIEPASRLTDRTRN